MFVPRLPLIPKRNPLFLCFFLLITSSALAQRIDSAMWSTDGNVKTIVRKDNIIYIGGNFNTVGPNQGAALPVSRSTGQLINNLPRFDDFVTTMFPDGNGGWFVAGDFRKVNDVNRNGIVHLNADLTVDLTWDAQLDSGAIITNIIDDKIYLHGYFTHAKGQPCSKYFTVIDKSTGNLLPQTITVDSWVNSIVATDNTFLLGGNFTTVNGTSKKYLVAVNKTNSAILPWKAAVNNSIDEILLKDTLVFLHGSFTTVNAASRNHVASVGVKSGLTTDWDAQLNGWVYGFTIKENTIFVGGYFSKSNSTSRSNVAAFDCNTGTLLPWNPGVNGTIQTVKVYDTLLYVGGQFDMVGNVTRLNLCAIDTKTGEPTTWNPSVTDGVYRVTIANNIVFSSGRGHGVGAVIRKNIAALDARTGKPIEWNPLIEREVYAIELAGDTVFVGGQYEPTLLNTTGIHAYSASTGQLYEWNAPKGFATTIKVYKNRVYVGGGYKFSGATALSHLSALDKTTGNLIYDFYMPPGDVLTSSIYDTTLYVGGQFVMISDQNRNYLAAINLNNNKVLPWAPKASSEVYALAATKDQVFIGGYFTNMNDVLRRGFAAVDPVTANLLPLDPNNLPYSISVSALSLGDSALYIGTSDQRSLSVIRGRIISVDLKTNQYTTLSTTPNYAVTSIAYAQNSLYMSGYFTKVDDRLISNFAALDGVGCSKLPSPIIDTNTVCENSAAQFSATSGQTWKMYASPSAILPISSGTTLVTPPLSDSREFYFSLFKGSCESERTPVMVAVKKAPATPALEPGDTKVCKSDVINAYSVIASADTDYQWSVDPSEAATITTTSANAIGIQWAEGFTGSATLSVKGVNECASSEAATLTINVAVCTGIDSQNAAITVSPNPSNGVFNINLEIGSSEKLKYQLINTDGKIVQSGELEKDHTQIIQPQRGLYLLKIIGRDFVKTYKLINTN